MDLTLFINLIVNQVGAQNEGVVPSAGKDLVDAFDSGVGHMVVRVFLKKKGIIKTPG